VHGTVRAIGKLDAKKAESERISARIRKPAQAVGCQEWRGFARIRWADGASLRVRGARTPAAPERRPLKPLARVMQDRSRSRDRSSCEARRTLMVSCEKPKWCP